MKNLTVNPKAALALTAFLAVVILATRVAWLLSI
jgi:hypothetical protein